jgi:hypothetical protein
MVFNVELYDPQTQKRFVGDDTLTKVTILDEDFPGILSFEETNMSVSKD